MNGSVISFERSGLADDGEVAGQTEVDGLADRDGSEGAVSLFTRSFPAFLSLGAAPRR